MVYKEFLDEVRDDFETNLNTFLQSIGLDGVSKFCTDGFSVDKNNSSLAVYAFSPNGPVMEYDGMYQTVRFTVEFYLNDKDGDNASLEILEDYFSALAFYITQRRYGGNGIIANSQLNRMDQGDMCNECLFLVESRIDTSMDYEDTYPVTEHPVTPDTPTDDPQDETDGDTDENSGSEP